MENKKEISEIAKLLGSKGGRATVEKYGKDYMSELGKKPKKKKKTPTK